MRFPEYSQKTDPALISAYIADVAQREQEEDRGVIKAEYLRVNRAARLIGQACVLLSQENTSYEPNKLLHQAVAEFAKISFNAQTDRLNDDTQASLLRQTAHILLGRTSPVSLDIQRRLMHIGIVAQLSAVHRLFIAQSQRYIDSGSNQSKGAMRHSSGSVSELTVLGAVTRLAHPKVLAMPSLTYHDRSSASAKNYDCSISRPKLDGYQTSRIQVKTSCIGLCNDPRPSPASLDKYGSDIVVISGHCDLGTMPDEYGILHFPYTLSLLEEISGTIAPNERERLDALSAWLCSEALDDPSRRGRHKNT